MATPPPEMKVLDIPEPKMSDMIATTIQQWIQFIRTFKRLYAVGSYWISDDDTNPGQIIGGTWERVDARFLLGAGTSNDPEGVGEVWENGAVGGTVAHRHLTAWGSDGERMFAFHNDEGVPYYGSEVTDRRKGICVTQVHAISDDRVRIAYTAHERNMPPFRVTNIWRRVA